MESDFVSANGTVFPWTISGFVSRVVAQTGSSVKEWFSVWPATTWDPGRYLTGFPEGARFVDVKPFANLPGWDPAFVYSRVIPGSDDPGFSTGEFFAGNREAQANTNGARNLSDVEPMAEGDFWELIKGLNGTATVAGVDALEEALADRPLAEIEAFARRMFIELQMLKTTAIANAAHEKPHFGSDAFLWWRMAVVAKGREAVASVAAGEPTPISENEWASAGMLDGVAERAVERREGDRPSYLYVPVRSRSSEGRTGKEDDVQAMLREKYGDGTIDRKPGPRTVAAMTSRGLLPSRVGSRFVVRAGRLSHECVVDQHIDTRGENVAQHLQHAADGFARELGGVVTSPIEYYDTGTNSLSEAAPGYIIRRIWKGTLDEYCERYGLTAV